MSEYKVYLDGMQLPYGVSKLTTKIKNRDEEVNLANGETISIPRSPGLTEWELETYVPKPDELLSKLETLKLNKHPFQFIITRTNSKPTNIQVLIEDYNRQEAAQYALGSLIKITLKEYRSVQLGQVELNDFSSYEVATAYRRLEKMIQSRKISVVTTYDLIRRKVRYVMSWRDVSESAFGSSAFWEEIRDTNADLMNDGSNTMIPTDDYPGLLYPKQRSKMGKLDSVVINIDTKAIAELGIERGKGSIYNPLTIIEDEAEETVPEPVIIKTPNYGSGTENDPYVFLLRINDNIDWVMTANTAVNIQRPNEQPKLPQGLYYVSKPPTIQGTVTGIGTFEGQCTFSLGFLGPYFKLIVIT